VVSWQVLSASGAALALSNPLNRVVTASSNPAVAGIVSTPTAGTVVAGRPGHATLRFTYQRKLASGAYVDVYNIRHHRRELVSVSAGVTVKSPRHAARHARRHAHR
jgi:hypothetical protein